MEHYNRNISVRGLVMLLMIIINGIVLTRTLTQDTYWYWALVVTIPLLCFVIWDEAIAKHRSRVK